MMDISETLWAGRREAVVDALNRLVPVRCEVREWPALERLRQFQNGYYDLYNNGGCNWEIRGPGFNRALGHVDAAPVRAGEDRPLDWPYGGEPEQETVDRIEEAGDRIIDEAVAEQLARLPADLSRAALRELGAAQRIHSTVHGDSVLCPVSAGLCPTPTACGGGASCARRGS